MGLYARCSARSASVPATRWSCRRSPAWSCQTQCCTRALKPIYADVEPFTFDVDPAAVDGDRSAHARAVVMQHTFGVTADVEALRAIAQRRGVALVEDAAHSRASHRGAPHGSLGDVAYFSIDRTKVIGAQTGGVVTTTATTCGGAREARDATPFLGRDGAPDARLLRARARPPRAPSLRWFGRPALGAARRAGLLFAWRDELETERPGTGPWPCRLPSGNAAIGRLQLAGLAENLAHRRRVARFLEERVGWFARTGRDDFDEQAWLRYSRSSFTTAEPSSASSRTASTRIWFTHHLYGREADTEAVGYRRGAALSPRPRRATSSTCRTHRRVPDLLARDWERVESRVLADLLNPTRSSRAPRTHF
ncbi:MAG: DegT/DnrJ/EryC1/StrS family aminotransferase [Planctomycetota bacterium]